jgi:Uncharacterized protein conserved in bacteria C-term(DUF2220)
MGDDAPALPFTPTEDVAAILGALLDIYERHDPRQPFTRARRVRLSDLALPGYGSQIDPAPRQTTNEQLRELERRGYVQLTWLRGEEGHLLDAATLTPERAPELFPWLGRDPLAAQRRALRGLLLGDRFRFPEGDWRRLAMEHTLAQLHAGRSPAPFVLDDPELNRNLLAALVALDQVSEETPYRVFSVRTYNDSKLFEGLRYALATLARRHGPGWATLEPYEALRELGLVPNPTHVYLFGPWRLVTGEGQLVTLDAFYPSAGVPALMTARLQHASVDTDACDRVVCVENLASFYELIRYEGARLAALCLWGNPAPAVRHLLACLAGTLPPEVPLQVWADLDWGGLNIVETLRRTVSARFEPYRMDIGTFEAHLRWARPLTDHDRERLARSLGHGALSDLIPLIEHLLARDLKLEQEAIRLSSLVAP